MAASSISISLVSHRPVVRQMATFGAIGAASTLAYVVLYAWLREAAPAAIANALALVATAVANTAANRRLTFGIRGSEGFARHHAAGLLALGAALAITSTSLVVLNLVAPHHGRAAEIAVLVLANAAATLVRFLLLRTAVDRANDAREPAGFAFATLSQSKGIRG
jgi:putative flippase GtrA